MEPDNKVDRILEDVRRGKSINRQEAELLLSFPENSLESALLRSTADFISRRRFRNHGLLLGQIGVDMSPCDGDCSFCFFAQSNTTVQPSRLSTDEVIARCHRYAEGGAQGVFLMTMNRFGFDWFRDLCATLRRSIPPHMEILANAGDMELEQLRELREAGVTGAYHVCRIREGLDSRHPPSVRKATIRNIIDAGLSWYGMCEPIGPEHTPSELVEQMWLGVEMPCRQHGAMQRFPVPGSALYGKGQISIARLSQIVAVIALATMNKKEMTSIAVNVSNVVSLMSGANAFFPEAGEPEVSRSGEKAGEGQGFTTALWRNSNEITTADCRQMMMVAGFTHLQDTNGAARVLL